MKITHKEFYKIIIFNIRKKKPLTLKQKTKMFFMPKNQWKGLVNSLVVFQKVQSQFYSNQIQAKLCKVIETIKTQKLLKTVIKQVNQKAHIKI